MDERLGIQLIFIFTSLLSITFSFNYYVHYRVLVLNRTFQQEENRRRYRAALVALAFSALVFIIALASLISGAKRSGEITVSPGAANTPSVQPTQLNPSAPLAVPTPAEPSGGVPAASETPTAIVSLARIGNTNSFGANIRTGPGLDSEIFITLMDDALVSVTEDSQASGGFTWKRIILEDGREGWVADIFLIFESE